MNVAQVLALARCFLLEVLRSRGALPGALLLVVTAFLAGRLVPEGTPPERLSLAVAHGLGLPCFLLGLWTVVAAAGLAGEIEARRLHLVATKPVGAATIILGRALGLLVVDAGLLLLLLVPLAVNTLAVLGAGPGGPGHQEVFRPGAGVERIHDGPSLLAPRAEVLPRPRIFDASEVARQAMSLGRESSGSREPSPRELEARARGILRRVILHPGEHHELELDVPGLAAGMVPGEKLPIVFVARSLQPGESSRLDLDWAFLDDAGLVASSASVRQALHGIPTRVELAPPGRLSGPLLRLRVTNPGGPGSELGVLIDPEDIRLLPRQGSTLSLCVGAAWLLLCRWGLVGVATLAAASIFQTSSSVLLGLFLFLSAEAAGFLRETFETLPVSVAGGGLLDWVGRELARLGSSALQLIPDFSRLDPVSRLAEGRALSFPLVAQESFLLLAPSAILALLAVLLLGRRELGR